MTVRRIVTGLLLSFVSAVSYAKELQPRESVCLESAVNQVIEATQDDLHLVRDPKTSLVVKIINLNTQESYNLAFISVNKNIEFISFENQTHLFNIWAQPTESCKVIETQIVPSMDDYTSKLTPPEEPPRTWDCSILGDGCTTDPYPSAGFPS
ncbi:hypothetical protein [Bdellovibrio sp. HCB2-146]|uniref:hypothetical protein n=1 Tax=Bdellovibrio sp. HCB2-146 TaxID=3394362 RepID=UPI0039BC90A3